MKTTKTQFGESATADFENGTWTFEMEKGMQIVSGKFAIVDRQVYDELLQALKEELEQLEEWNGNGNYSNRIDKIKTLIKKTTE